MEILKWIAAALLLVACAHLPARELRFNGVTPGAATADPESFEALAGDALTAYEERDRAKYLGNLFRLQQVAGRYRESATTIRLLREVQGPQPAAAPPLYFQYEVYVEAKALQRELGIPFADAFARSFHCLYSKLDDRTAQRVLFSLGAHVPRMREDLDRAVAEHGGEIEIGIQDALDLLRKYQVHEAYSAFAPLINVLVAQDDARRYIVERDLLIEMPDGAMIAAMVVRPRNRRALPGLLQFTIYANDDWAFSDAKKSAAYGYAGVVAYTRGKGKSPGPTVPFEHDGKDAAAVVDWMAAQPWSDGRVGMYGGSYSGFTQWAALKHRPKALKAIAASATAAPGIDVPMEGNVFLNFMYPWPFYTTNNDSLDDDTYGDQARWKALNRSWYERGAPYRSLADIDGAPNPVFEQWLEHPAYDDYWQRLIPQGRQYATIDVPILATTGYFDGAQVGVLHYLTEHLRHRPDADHTLLIGPYEHFTMQAGVSRNVGGYSVDPVAQLDLQELRMQWFDHVFHGADKPDVLKDRINYQVMGANTWKHAPSIEAMSNRTFRFHLTSNDVSARGATTTAETSPDGSTLQVVDFADRGDAAYVASDAVLVGALDTRNAVVFATGPFERAQELSGRFSGVLAFTSNKRDFDFTIVLYELMPSGEYLQLPHFMRRASYGGDRDRRRLLVPGQLHRLVLESERLTSRLLEPGSRVVVVLSVNKRPDLQINYGTGGDVSAEGIGDARVPLEVRWHPGSYIDLPLAD